MLPCVYTAYLRSTRGTTLLGEAHDRVRADVLGIRNPAAAGEFRVCTEPFSVSQLAEMVCAAGGAMGDMARHFERDLPSGQTKEE